MKQFESANYVFHYNEGSLAERDLPAIVQEQEACFRYICAVLRVKPDYKLRYFLCDSPEEVSRINGYDDPCNGCSIAPDKVYAVYNDKTKCIGFHEDAHLISWLVGQPDSVAMREGLAMYFDRKWWGIQNLDWTQYYQKTGKLLPIPGLLDNEAFFAADCSVTYPIVGAFTDWLIATFGIEKYLAFYKEKDAAAGLRNVYRTSPEELNAAFVDYLRLFSVDNVLEARMEALLLAE